MLGIAIFIIITFGIIAFITYPSYHPPYSQQIVSLPVPDTPTDETLPTISRTDYVQTVYATKTQSDFMILEAENVDLRDQIKVKDFELLVSRGVCKDLIVERNEAREYAEKYFKLYHELKQKYNENTL